MSRKKRSRLAAMMAALEDHAKDLQPLALPLAIGYVVELSPLGWKAESVMGGANSVKLTSPAGSEFHFRTHAGHTEIRVYDRYLHDYSPSNVTALIKTRLDAVKFIERCVTIP